MLKKFPVISVAILLSVCTTACINTFSLVDHSFTPKGKTIAVIAGTENDISVYSANYTAEALAKHSKFKVLPPSQVARAIPNYPQRIKGPYSTAYFEIEADYSKTDLNKIKEMQQKLGVDYLLLIPTLIQPKFSD